MKQLASIAALCFLCNAAMGDFELKDPALPNEEAANAPPAVKEVADYAVEGAGVKSCASYKTDSNVKGSMFYIDLNWAKGFITGVNYIHEKTMGNTQLGAGLDLDALTLWINNYCGEHPAGSLADASAALVEELMN